MKPFAAVAQEPGRTYRLGVVSAIPCETPVYVALYDELRRYGLGKEETMRRREFIALMSASVALRRSSPISRPPFGSQAAHQRRGPAHRRQHRQAAGAAASSRETPETTSGLLWPGAGPSAAKGHPLS